VALVRSEHVAKRWITRQKSGDRVGIKNHRHSSGST
jgi:hypothetical protein